MAFRIIKLLPRCSLQSFSLIRFAEKPLSSHKGCLYHLSVLRCSVPAPTPTTKRKPQIVKPEPKKRTPVQEFEDQFKTKKYHEELLEIGYVPIYKFRYAGGFGALNKVKWQQLYVTSGATSLAVFLASVGYLPFMAPIAVVTVGGILTSTMWIFAALFSRVVGAILVSPDNEIVCISYVDGKGNRVDDLFPVKDLVPLADSPSQKYFTRYFIKVYRYNDIDEEGETRYEPYKLFVQNYDIFERKKFMDIFGSLL